MRSNDTQALVIIPTFNERENIETVVNGLMEISGISVLIVDDEQHCHDTDHYEGFHERDTVCVISGCHVMLLHIIVR
ncbi:hypothetical protein ACFLZO_00415 [Patescibacteria group bacterium]